MRPERGGGEFQKDVIEGGNEFEAVGFALGFELFAEVEKGGGVAARREGHGDRGLAAELKASGDGFAERGKGQTSTARRRQSRGAGRRDRAGVGRGSGSEDIAFANAAAFARGL